MKKKLLTMLLIVMVLVASLSLFTACNNEKPAVDENVTNYAIPAEFTPNISLYDSTTLLGKITKDTLSELTQYRVTMKTTNTENTYTERTYIGYKMTDILTKMNITVPATITKIVPSDSSTTKVFSETVTSFANAYITIGLEEDGALVADGTDNGSSPRYVSDCTSTSSNSVWKSVDKITINPIDLTKPVLVVKMTQGTKTNDIEIPNTAYATTVENVKYDYTKNDVVTSFYGFNLKDVIASMGKIKSTGSWISFLSDYSHIGFVCSDDVDGTDYSTRVFTKAEVEAADTYISVVYDTTKTQTRIFSDLADALFRSKLQKITEIVVYNADNTVNATLEISWKY